ncbi:helix-turn-helix domain-containing protein [Providencia sp. PROV111]|uniref:helix-turn-helix domain-containing protein n=1 Tax=Providencia sp. PROV111 TaxID=2949822 RepID=UPI00234B7B01|nr:helix-turn-helix transcriptional regulator [Providencia sp. PROV111]
MCSGNEINYKHSLNKRIGLFLRKNRLNADLTGKELGQLMYISQQQISRHETGVCNLTITQLDNYLMVLGVSWSEFIREVIKEDCWG